MSLNTANSTSGGGGGGVSSSNTTTSNASSSSCVAESEKTALNPSKAQQVVPNTKTQQHQHSNSYASRRVH